MTRLAQMTGILLAMLAIGACSESGRPVASGKASVRGIHAIVGSPQVNFLIEKKGLGTIAYKQAAGFVDYDDLDYTFNFESIAFNDQPARTLASQYVDFEVDTEYTLVLTGTLNNPSVMMWEEPEAMFDGTETYFEMDFVHLSPLTGEVDVYFALTDTVPVLGNEIATLQYGDRVPYQQFQSGTYEIIVTAPDDPDTVLFKSLNIPASPSSRVTTAVFDADPSITAPLAIALINTNGAQTTLADVDHPSQLRILHTAFGTQSTDGYYDSDFDNIVFSDIAFGELSPYADIPNTGVTLNLTAVGDSATLVFEGNAAVPPNGFNTLIFGGSPDALGFKALRDDARPLVTYPLVRITDMAGNFDSIDIYILEPGTPIDDQVVPSIINAVPAYGTDFLPFVPGQREITLTANGEKTAIATPLLLDAAPGDIVDIIILDTADPSTLEIKVFDTNQAP